jgi:predicted nucleic acid-binding protein
MNGKVLLDTNILVYIYDPLDTLKQDRAIAIVDRLIQTTRAVISPQVMGEFFLATTRPKRPLLNKDEAIARMRNYIAACQMVDVTELIVLEATRGVEIHYLPYWDAQIWATARLNQISQVYSEDFNSGASLEGIHFINPLVDSFKIS